MTFPHRESRILEEIGEAVKKIMNDRDSLLQSIEKRESHQF